MRLKSPGGRAMLCGMTAAADDIFLDVFKAATSRRLQPGEVLIHAGDPAERVYTILDGMLMVSRLGLDGRRQVLSFMFPGHFVGLTASRVYNFTIEAVVPSVVAGQPRKLLDRRLASDRAAERAFIAMTYRAMDNLIDLVFSLCQRTARERLAVFVLYLRHRYLLAAGLALADDQAMRLVPLPMSRVDIADFTGLKKETVSRSLAQLEREGLLARRGDRDVEILDLAGLRQVAGVLDFSSPMRMPGDRPALP